MPAHKGAGRPREKRNRGAFQSLPPTENNLRAATPDFTSLPRDKAPPWSSLPHNGGNATDVDFYELFGQIRVAISHNNHGRGATRVLCKATYMLHCKEYKEVNKYRYKKDDILNR